MTFSFTTQSNSDTYRWQTCFNICKRWAACLWSLKKRKLRIQHLTAFDIKDFLQKHVFFCYWCIVPPRGWEHKRFHNYFHSFPPNSYLLSRVCLVTLKSFNLLSTCSTFPCDLPSTTFDRDVLYFSGFVLCNFYLSFKWYFYFFQIFSTYSPIYCMYRCVLSDVRQHTAYRCQFML